MRANGVKILAGTDQSGYLESKGSVPGCRPQKYNPPWKNGPTAER
jgi:hypothetical protein